MCADVCLRVMTCADVHIATIREIPSLASQLSLGNRQLTNELACRKLTLFKGELICTTRDFLDSLQLMCAYVRHLGGSADVFFCFALVTGPRRSLSLRVIQESMRLKYEPASKPLHIYVKWLFDSKG